MSESNDDLVGSPTHSIESNSESSQSDLETVTTTTESIPSTPEPTTNTSNSILSTTQSTAQNIDEKCSICIEPFKDKSVLIECGHMFCYNCIVTWAQMETSCPLCRQDFTRVMHELNGQDGGEIVVIDELLHNLDNSWFLNHHMPAMYVHNDMDSSDDSD